MTVVVSTPRRGFLQASLVAALAGRGPGGSGLRDLFGRYLHCVNHRDALSLSRLFTETAEYRDVSFGVRLIGRDAIRNMFARTFTALGSAEFVVKSSAFDGDTIAVRWETTGRHQGPLLGVPGSGRPLTLGGASFMSVASGRVQEQVDYLDRAGLERQLGVRGAGRE